MKSGRNVVELGTAVTAALAELRATLLPPDLELTVINDLRDRSTSVSGSSI